MRLDDIKAIYTAELQNRSPFGPIERIRMKLPYITPVTFRCEIPPSDKIEVTATSVTAFIPTEEAMSDAALLDASELEGAREAMADAVTRAVNAQLASVINGPNRMSPEDYESTAISIDPTVWPVPWRNYRLRG